MEEGKKRVWVKILFSVWMLLTVAVGHISEMQESFVGDPARWQILYYIMISVATVCAVVSFVYSIKNVLRKWLRVE